MFEKEFSSEIESAFEVLLPTEIQLERLHRSILDRENVPNPYDDLPHGLTMQEMRKMQVFTETPDWDENLSPASIYKTHDGRVLWITVFRNPDTNAIVEDSVLLVDPTDDNTQLTYSLRRNEQNKYELRKDGVELSGPELDDLQYLIDNSSHFDVFGAG